MEVISVFAVIAAIIALGYLSEQIFKKTNIPDVLILILVGISIGTVLQWASPEQFGVGSELFTTFALVFILFQGALNIDFRVLLQSLSSTSFLTVFSFILAALVVTGISYMFFQDWLLATLIGMILGGTSSAVVIPIVKNLAMRDKYSTVLKIESAISDVLCIVGAVTVISIYETQQIVASGIFNQVLSSFALAILMGLAIGMVWIIMLNKFASLRQAYMVGIAIVIAIYAFVESPWVGASGPIAALAFGLVWGNAQPILRLMHAREQKEEKEFDEEDAHEHIGVQNVLDPSARNFFAEIGFFVKVFFFVYLGILIDFTNPQTFVYGALLTLVMFLIRPLAVKAVFRKSDATVKERTLLEVLIPKGLAAAVLVQLAVHSNIFSSEAVANEVGNIVLSVILLSILLTGALAFLTEKGWFRGIWHIFSGLVKVEKVEKE